LTDTNSSQSARNLRLNLTGSVGAPQNLIVPAIEKVYIINNGLTQTITVKNASGTGISVPAGKTEYVYNNGTNVVEAINHLTSLTLDTALPITSGGTGANTAANARTSLGLVIGTDVLAPNGSGASLTSLNASSISSGTIANARTTASDANGASTIVARDASGNFAGATITANTFSGSGASLTSLNASNVSSGTLAVARGGTGTASPSLVGGTNITISGSWPNQTVTAAGGGVTSLNGQTGAITDTDFAVIGSYSVLQNATNSNLGIGSTRAGSSLRYNSSFSSATGGSNTAASRFQGVKSQTGDSTYGGGGTSVSGTWRKMCDSNVYGSQPTCCGILYVWSNALYVRIS
jgi:hypothetical protein